MKEFSIKFTVYSLFKKTNPPEVNIATVNMANNLDCIFFEFYEWLGWYV